MPTVVQLSTGKAVTVQTAADLFLDSIGNPNTARNYGIAVAKTAERLGEGRPFASVEDDEVGEALELLWGGSAVNTWNARRGAARCCPGPAGARSAGTTGRGFRSERSGCRRRTRTPRCVRSWLSTG